MKGDVAYLLDRLPPISYVFIYLGKSYIYSELICASVDLLEVGATDKANIYSSIVVAWTTAFLVMKVLPNYW